MTDGVTPEVFEVYVGSFNSPSYGVWWDGERLVYESFLRGYKEREQSSMVPSSAQWSRFWRTMEEIDVWSWKNGQEQGERLEPAGGTRDGTHWSLTLTHDGRSVESAGDHGPAATDPDDSARFEAFAEAVSRLTGGYAFR